MNQRISAKHGVIGSLPSDFYGYFGWPSVARMDNGVLVAAASGFRNAHVCPFGRTVMFFSADRGETWRGPKIVNDGPLDDRDAGILSLGGRRLLVSWFTSDTRKLAWEQRIPGTDETAHVFYETNLKGFTDEVVRRGLGSWIRISSDGGETWGEPHRVPGTAPHGPIRLKDGRLLYFGKEFPVRMENFSEGAGDIGAWVSEDGENWKKLGKVPLYPDTDARHYHEPHVAEREDGSLIGLIRFQNRRDQHDVDEMGLVSFSLMQTLSSDGGRTWSPAVPLGFHGSPPHVIRHSTGVLVCAYGFRKVPYGQRVMTSRNGGNEWAYDYILRDDGPDSDLGYPASVELEEGSLLTVYYQKIGSAEEKCSLLWSRWSLPD